MRCMAHKYMYTYTRTHAYNYVCVCVYTHVHSPSEFFGTVHEMCDQLYSFIHIVHKRLSTYITLKFKCYL
jgi:hypothetical protein